MKTKLKTLIGWNVLTFYNFESIQSNLKQFSFLFELNLFYFYWGTYPKRTFIWGGEGDVDLCRSHLWEIVGRARRAIHPKQNRVNGLYEWSLTNKKGRKRFRPLHKIKPETKDGFRLSVSEKFCCKEKITLKTTSWESSTSLLRYPRKPSTIHSYHGECNERNETYLHVLISEMRNCQNRPENYSALYKFWT